MKKLIVLSLLFITISCNEEEEKFTPDYLIFGDFYGECAGEGCIDIYKIENTSLYEDITDDYPSWETPYDGNYIERSADDYNNVKELLTKFPKQLLQEKDTVLGQPDAGDWGGYYIEVRYKNQRRFWLIDKIREDVPAYLKPFLDDLEDKLKLL